MTVLSGPINHCPDSSHVLTVYSLTASVTGFSLPNGTTTCPTLLVCSHSPPPDAGYSAGPETRTHLTTRQSCLLTPQAHRVLTCSHPLNSGLLPACG